MGLSRTSRKGLGSGPAGVRVKVGRGCKARVGIVNSKSHWDRVRDVGSCEVRIRVGVDRRRGARVIV